MKTKITLIAVTLLMLTSCIKNYINDHPHNDDKVVFTETNYAYEPELYKQYLQIELKIAVERRDFLQGVIANGQGTKKDIEERDALNERIEYLNPELESALSNIENLVLAKPIPCPESTGFDLCYPNLDKLVFPRNREILGFIVLTENQEEIHNINKSEQLGVPGLENFATYQNIDLEGYKGKLNFVVTRKDLNGEEITYLATATK